MTHKPRIVQVNDLPRGNRECTCCGKMLKGKVAWLELDQRTDTYHDDGDVPPEQSQGWFPFGVTCATNLIKAHAQHGGSNA